MTSPTQPAQPGLTPLGSGTAGSLPAHEVAGPTVDPSDHVDWTAYTHQELYAMVMSANPQAIQERAQTVQQYARDMHDVTGFVHDTAQNMFGLWSGSSADQAAQTINKVTKWADHTAETASHVAHNIGQYADALNEARATMPEPINWGAVNKALSGGTVHLNTSGFNAATVEAIEQGHHLNTQQAQQKELANKNKAVEVMQKYHTTSASIYRSTPTFANPPGITQVPIDPVQAPPTWPPVVTTPVSPVNPPTQPIDPTDPGNNGDNGTTTTSSAAPMTVSGATPGFAPGTGGLPGGNSPGIAALGGLGSGGLVNNEGGWGGFGSSGGAGAAPSSSGTSPTSGARVLGRAAAANEEAAAPRGAVAEGEGEGWGGFGPMGGMGTGRDGDSGHRDKYGLEPDVIGELPPAFPPVLGL